jgi:transposase
VGWAEQDAGVRPGPTSAETERIRELERAKTANYVGQTEILKAASVFFAGELDPSSTLDCHACNVRHGI